jgi:tight adherence protein B
LPDALDFMAGALRAGHGLALSFRMIAEEMPTPISDEFRLVNEKIAFGAAFQEAVNDMRDRVPSQDLDFLVVGLLIQRETGGNIAELFTNLSSLGRERFKLNGKVKVLVSEGKLSGWLLGGLPFVLGGLMTLLNPQYMAPLWSTERGHDLLLMGGGMMAVGFAWMSHIARIRV